MITNIKKIKNGYKIEEFVFKEKKIKKERLDYTELIKKLNYNYSNIDEIKTDLLLEKYAYKNKKNEEMFNNGVLAGTFFISASIILFYICPILVLPLFVFTLYGIKYVFIKTNKDSKEKDIYDKLILYYENIDVCKKIKSNSFDGTIFSLYFNSEREIRKVIEETRKNIKCNIYVEKNNIKVKNKVKKLVHTRNVK